MFINRLAWVKYFSSLLSRYANARFTMAIPIYVLLFLGCTAGNSIVSYRAASVRRRSYCFLRAPPICSINGSRSPINTNLLITVSSFNKMINFYNRQPYLISLCNLNSLGTPNSHTSQPHALHVSRLTITLSTKHLLLERFSFSVQFFFLWIVPHFFIILEYCLPSQEIDVSKIAHTKSQFEHKTQDLNPSAHK